MESINVVCAVLLKHRYDALTHAGQQRGDDDCSENTDDDTQDCEEAAKLVTANAVDGHAKRLAHLASRNLIERPEYLHNSQPVLHRMRKGNDRIEACALKCWIDARQHSDCSRDDQC